MSNKAPDTAAAPAADSKVTVTVTARVTPEVQSQLQALRVNQVGENIEILSLPQVVARLIDEALAARKA